MECSVCYAPFEVNVLNEGQKRLHLGSKDGALCFECLNLALKYSEVKE